MPRKQCKKCPWKVSADPHEIPNGYSVERHKGLASTIAEPGTLHGIGGPLRIMACHETHDTPCVGWLVNQLGPGNNLPLRLAVIYKRIDGDVQTVGPQHACLEDTLPMCERAKGAKGAKGWD